jgi:hypothetical protein
MGVSSFGVQFVVCAAVVCDLASPAIRLRAGQGIEPALPVKYTATRQEFVSKQAGLPEE